MTYRVFLESLPGAAVAMPAAPTARSKPAILEPTGNGQYHQPYQTMDPDMQQNKTGETTPAYRAVPPNQPRASRTLRRELYLLPSGAAFMYLQPSRFIRLSQTWASRRSYLFADLGVSPVCSTEKTKRCFDEN